MEKHDKCNQVVQKYQQQEIAQIFASWYKGFLPIY